MNKLKQQAAAATKRIREPSGKIKKGQAEKLSLRRAISQQIICVRACVCVCVRVRESVCVCAMWVLHMSEMMFAQGEANVVSVAPVATSRTRTLHTPL